MECLNCILSEPVGIYWLPCYRRHWIKQGLSWKISNSSRFGLFWS